MKYCTNCGTQLSDTDMICPSCQKSQEDSFGSAAAQPYQQQGYQQPTYQQQQYQQQPYQPMYQQQPTYNNFQGNSPETVTMGEWLINMLLCCIPIVNLIMLFVWAFGGGSQPSMRNWARAQFIVFLVGLIPMILFITWFASSVGRYY